MELRDIERTFVETLVYPEKAWGGTQFVLCVAAAIGSGKTTVMSRLAQSLGLVHIRSDALRLLFVDAGIEYDSNSLGHILRNVCVLLIDQGYSISLDMNAGSDRTKRLLTQVEQEFALTILWLTFTLSEDEAERRIRSRENIIHGDPESAIQNRRRQLAKGEAYLQPGKAPVYIFDELTDLEIQLEVCEQAIRQALK